MELTPQQLQINPEFRLMVAPMSEAKRLKQEKWMAHRGQSLPIRVWEETILVDYETHSYSLAHGLPLRVSRVLLKTYEDAVIWICRDQLKRKDLTEEMRKYLIGKLYRVEKRLGASERSAARGAIRAGEKPIEFMQTPTMQEATAIQIAKRIGADHCISYETVRKYNNYASAIDYLYALEPLFVQKILQGAIHISHETLMEIKEMNRVELTRIARYFLDENERKPTFAKYRAKQDEKKANRRNTVILAGSVKEMPDYDPDAEIVSLALTIPSWIGSIQRTKRNTDYSKISDKARARSICQLQELSDAAESLRIILKEEPYG